MHQLQPCTSKLCHVIQNHIHRCRCVSCHLHVWQNDLDSGRSQIPVILTNVQVAGYSKTHVQANTGINPREQNVSTAHAGTRTNELSITSPALYH